MKNITQAMASYLTVPVRRYPLETPEEDDLLKLCGIASKPNERKALIERWGSA
jgi:hypothetical protein